MDDGSIPQVVLSLVWRRVNVKLSEAIMLLFLTERGNTEERVRGVVESIDEARALGNIETRFLSTKGLTPTKKTQ